jgi:4-aminobutyrate aminotransferase/(S)-3-amino-2-methylpropionate transaminase
MTERLVAAAGAQPMIGDVRGRGAMVGIELVTEDGVTPARQATANVAAACHAQGLIVLTAGTYGNVLRLLPPLVMPDHLLDEGLSILEEALAAA